MISTQAINILNLYKKKQLAYQNYLEGQEPGHSPYPSKHSTSADSASL